MKKVNAYLQITMKIKESDRQSAAKVYFDYRQPFLDTIEGALTKALLVRDRTCKCFMASTTRSMLPPTLSQRCSRTTLPKVYNLTSKPTQRFASSA